MHHLPFTFPFNSALHSSFLPSSLFPNSYRVRIKDRTYPEILAPCVPYQFSKTYYTWKNGYFLPILPIHLTNTVLYHPLAYAYVRAAIVRSPLNYAFQVGGFCEGKTSSHFQSMLKTSATFDPSTQSVCPTLLCLILGAVRKECRVRIWR